MKLALTHPFAWPWVRRGGERNIADLSRFLSGRGHDVTVIASKPGPPAIDHDSGARRILLRQPWVPAILRERIQPTHTFFFGCLQQLLSLDVDAVHCGFYIDAYAACLAKRFRKFRTVFQVSFLPLPLGFARRLPPELTALRGALERSDRVLAVSQHVADAAEEHFGVKAVAIPPPLRIEDFPLGSGPVDGVPTLLSVADFNARRKGVRVLVKAFELIRREVTGLRLWLTGHMSQEVETEVLGPLDKETRAAVRVFGVGDVQNLPSLYQQASVMVLPSMWEAAGMVLFEAWASGAVAVGTRHGGIPEFMTPDVGELFDPKSDGSETMNVEGLAEAILKALRLSGQPGIRERCRLYAHRFSWERLGPEIERLYVA